MNERGESRGIHPMFRLREGLAPFAQLVLLCCSASFALHVSLLLVHRIHLSLFGSYSTCCAPSFCRIVQSFASIVLPPSLPELLESNLNNGIQGSNAETQTWNEQLGSLGPFAAGSPSLPSPGLRSGGTESEFRGSQTPALLRSATTGTGNVSVARPLGRAHDVACKSPP